MIQDIAPHRYDNAYKPKAPEKDSIVLCYKERSCLLKMTEEGIRFPVFRELEEENPEIYEKATYLFSIDGERYYLLEAVDT